MFVDNLHLFMMTLFLGCNSLFQENNSAFIMPRRYATGSSNTQLTFKNSRVPYMKHILNLISYSHINFRYQQSRDTSGLIVQCNDSNTLKTPFNIACRGKENFGGASSVTVFVSENTFGDPSLNLVLDKPLLIVDSLFMFYFRFHSFGTERGQHQLSKGVDILEINVD